MLLQITFRDTNIQCINASGMLLILLYMESNVFFVMVMSMPSSDKGSTILLPIVEKAITTARTAIHPKVAGAIDSVFLLQNDVLIFF